MTALLEGKVALVTGAGHGIGRSHALELARNGARVVVNDLGSSVDGSGAGRDADVVVKLIEERGGQAIADYGDVGDEAAADAMVKAGIDEWGQLDIVVNNAGIVRDSAIWNMSLDDFELVMGVHLRGTWLTTRAAARYWRAQSKAGAKVAGRIINTISGAGLSGNFGQSNYATAKAAIMGLTLTTSLELAGSGVTVNAIGPGALTRITATTGMGDPIEPEALPEEETDKFDPRASSPVVAWLASDAAANVSGQCFKAMGDEVQWMEGWTTKVAIRNGGKRWDAAKLGRRIESEVFGTRAPGLQLGA